MKYAVSFIGWSNTGKTGLIGQLLVKLRSRGYSVAVLKQSHVPADIDRSGKDTDRFFEKGADKVGYFSPNGGFLRFRHPPEVGSLEHYFSDCEILLLESLPLGGYPCFEVVGPENEEKGYKTRPEEVTGYIWNGEHPPTGRQLNGVPVLSSRDPDKIIHVLEELWNIR
ncbi:MAG TPA: hypothetical protein ENN41_04890 [Sediminispirochaeta sp.]|nr:hypothetical protein [Sediminispirochaeta sp.]